MPRPNLNYFIYQVARNALHRSQCLVPISLLPRRQSLKNQFCIGITTYIERYEHQFKPLYKRLCRIFPDVTIIVVVNGSGDQQRQKTYLETFEHELCAHAPPHHKFVLHDHVVGLTTLWNEIFVLSDSLPVLILNDDLRVYPWLRRWAENYQWQSACLSLLNNSWSHFVISDQAFDRIGCFDTGFLGIGFEDMDYTARAGLAGVAIENLYCPYIVHTNHQPVNTSFDLTSGRVWGKYTAANHDRFFSKWESTEDPDGVYIRQLHSHVRPKHTFDDCILPPSVQRLATLIPSKLIYPDRLPSVSDPSDC